MTKLTSAQSDPAPQSWLATTSDSDGRIPFSIRVGVTGHRRLDNEEEVRAAARHALARVRQLYPATPTTRVHLIAVSALAEGADRLLAREVLGDPAGRLEAFLPLQATDYENDFTSETSRKEFRALLARADQCSVPEHAQNREASYEWAGQAVVAQSDVVIAIWDGRQSRGRGGTAQIVDHVRMLRKPLIWIQLSDRCRLAEERTDEPIEPVAFAELDAFNRARFRSNRFKSSLANARRQFLPPGQPSVDQSSAERLDRLADWVGPHYTRADLIALAAQRRFFLLLIAMLFLAAFAIVTIAAQTLFWPSLPWIAWIEFAFLMLMVALLWLGHKARPHDRWILHRFLAERFRSVFYLAAAGLRQAAPAELERANLGYPSEEWINRAYAEVWRYRPDSAHTLDDKDVPWLQRLLADGWLRNQERYHRQIERRNQTLHHQLTVGLSILFAVTAVAALLHSLALLSEETLEGRALVFICLALPAFGGALSGLRAQREFLRHSKRSAKMAADLALLRDRMQVAQNLDAVHALARQAERLMSDEGRDWFGLVLFHDIEIGA